MKLAGACVLLCACSVPQEAGFPDVRRAVAEKSGASVSWYQDAAVEQRIRDGVRKLVAEPLTIERAVRLALLNNRQLQASFERLGVAQADVVQAGMIANPTLAVTTRIPTSGSASPNVEGLLGFDLLSLLSRSARQRVSEERLEATKLAVADVALGLIYQVRRAFYELQAAQQLEAVDRAIAETAQGSFDAATALHQAGNVSELQLAQEQALYERARLSWMQSQGRVIEAREALNELCGLWGAEANAWRVSEALPGVPAEEVDLDQLETLAVRERLDLQAHKRHTQVLVAALQLEGDWGWLHHFELGPAAELESFGELRIGPELSVALPIFDQGQARVARLRAELRESYHELTAMAVRVRADVRRARDKLVRHRRMAEHYREVVVPLRERIVRLTLEQYDFMLVGVFELLEKKQMESEAYHQYLDEVRDYWLTRAELERAVGGRLPPPPEPLPIAPPPAPPPAHHHGD